MRKMNSGDSFEDLHERFERLVLKRPALSRDSVVSEEKRRHIADKFASKSLQELNEIAGNLPQTY